MLWPARLIGAGTAIYGLTVLLKPAVLAKPAALTEDDGHVSEKVQVLTRATASRDLVTGVAMALAPTASSVRVAGKIRIASDVSDALGLGTALATKEARQKSALVACGSGFATAVALWLARADL